MLMGMLATAVSIAAILLAAVTFGLVGQPATASKARDQPWVSNPL
jgi:hypothetical protein